MRKTLLVSLLIVGAAVLGTAAFLFVRAPAGPAATNARSAASASARASTANATADADGDDDDDDGQTTAEGRAGRRSAAASRAAPVWTVDKADSRLSFRGIMNGAPFDGVFRDWDAQIAFDPHNLANSHASVTVDTASALTGEPLKDQALPNSEWLNVGQYPDATLVTRSITQVAPGRYTAAVDVHIRGVRWRTTVPFNVAISHDQGRVEATMTVDRRTFGIGEGPFQSPPPVEPMVQVTLKLSAKKGR